MSGVHNVLGNQVLTLRLIAELDEQGNGSYAFVCMGCLGPFHPAGEYPDDHAKVIDDMLRHQCPGRPPLRPSVP